MASAERRLRRILVAVEPSAYGEAAIDAAARIAASLQAELVGIYVQDEALLRLAGLPFVREFSVHGVGGRVISSASMTRALRSEAARARAVLARVAERHRVPWTFDTRQGDVTTELLAAAASADLLVLGRTRAAGGRHPPVGSTVRSVARRCTTAMLVVHRSAWPRGPVVALYEDETSSPVVLAMAAALAHADATDLIVLVASPELVAPAEAALATEGIAGRVVPAAPDGVAATLARIAGPTTPTLVAHRTARAQAALDALVCPVVLVG